MMKRCLFCLILLCLSCDKVENPIGNFRVYLRLDMNNKDKALRTVGSKAYTMKDVNAGFEQVGFGGVLAVHAVDDCFYAFDLACPHEASRNVLIAADENTIYAVCPKCGTKYDIAFGTGAPDGVSKYYLKRYTVVGAPPQLTVVN
jgi:uncharacterized Zn-finger protein